MKTFLTTALLLLCLPGLAFAQCDPAFDDVVRYGLTEEPWSVIAGDFDGDGRPDIAAVGNSSPSASLLLNRGGGMFVHGEPIPLAHPSSMLHGPVDLDDDGPDDFVAIGPAGITAVMAQGNGTFRTERTTAGGGNLSRFSAAGDLNGDGRIDLAISASPRVVRVFLGSSGGRFTEAAPIALGSNTNVFEVDLGDATGDGRADIVVSDNRAGVLLEGNGDGTFKPARDLIPGLTTARRVVLADFDGDGRVDVLAGSTLIPAAQPATRRNVPLFGNEGWAVDLDGDGKLDVFSMAELHRNNGDGTFTFAGLMSDSGPARLSPAFADFDGDGRLDVAFGTASHDITIYRGLGGMRFEGGPAARGNTPHGQLAAGDVNGDGRADVVMIAPFDAFVYLAQPDGSLSFKSHVAVRSAFAAVIGDFNGDAKADLYVDGSGLAAGNGDGTFADTPTASDDDASDAVAADFNGDGKPDVALARSFFASDVQFGGVTFFTNDGAGAFTRTESAPLPPVWSIAAADFNRDGSADVVAATNARFEGPGELYLLDGRAPQSPVRLASNVLPENIAAGDVDGDGFADIVALSYPIDEVLIFGGNGNGTFRAPRRINVPDGAIGGGVTLADFSGDGRLDVAVSIEELHEILLFVQQGDGSFVETAHTAALFYGETAADVDGDGRLDLILDHDRTGLARVAFNRCRQELRLMPPVVRLSAGAASIEGTAAVFEAELDPAATGTVMFYEWTTRSRLTGQPVPLGSASVQNGRATLTTTALTRGTHEIHAVYLGDGPFVRSRSATIEHTVTPPATGGKRRSAS